VRQRKRDPGRFILLDYLGEKGYHIDKRDGLCRWDEGNNRKEKLFIL